MHYQSRKYLYHMIMLLFNIEIFVNFNLTESVQISERPDK